MFFIKMALLYKKEGCLPIGVEDLGDGECGRGVVIEYATKKPGIRFIFRLVESENDRIHVGDKRLKGIRVAVGVDEVWGYWIAEWAARAHDRAACRCGFAMLLPESLEQAW